MQVKQMHIMRIKEEEARRLSKKNKKISTPLAKEIEIRREEMIRGILENTKNLINKQLEVASLPVQPEGRDNDVVLKSSNSLLDRVFGKPKESIDFTGNVQFSLKALAEERLKVASEDVTPLDELIEADG